MQFESEIDIFVYFFLRIAKERVLKTVRYGNYTLYMLVYIIYCAMVYRADAVHVLRPCYGGDTETVFLIFGYTVGLICIIYGIHQLSVPHH